MNKSQFRLDIQSLRAISVALVIFYHFNFTFDDYAIFSGGFIGVDIFFVISGYVIANIIINEIKKKNEFNLLLFIEKRFRRLIPALYFLFFIIFVLSFFLLLPKYFTELSYTIIFNIFFSSNFYFWENLAQYGAIMGMDRPLLHTWSLSVEWQFYIFTSIIFVTFRKYLFKRFNFYFLILFTISFIINQYILVNQSNFNFYFSGSRYWEFVLGILIRYNNSNIKLFVKKNLNNLYIDYFLYTSLFFIIFFSLSYQFFEHKNFLYIASIIAASIIIALGDSKSSFSKLINSKILVSIGAISYSLYIWHYPIASFFYTTEYDYKFTNLVKLIIFIPLIMISIFSYNYVENIFRNSSIISKKFFFRFFITTSVIFFILSFITIKNDGFSERISLSKGQKEFIIDYDKDRKDPSHYPGLYPIEIDKNKKTLLIIGNSHGSEYFELLSKVDYIKEKYNIIYSYVQIKCLKNLIANINKSNCFRKLEFSEEQEFQNKMKLLNQVDLIVLKTKWSDDDIEILPKVIKFFQNKGIETIVTSENPFFKIINNEVFDTKKKYKNKILLHSLFQKGTILDKYFIINNKLPIGEDLVEMEKEYYNKINWDRYELKNSKLKSISIKNNAKFFNDFEIFCNTANERCDVLVNGNKIHWDDEGHATFKSKDYLSKKLVQNTKLKSLF